MLYRDATNNVKYRITIGFLSYTAMPQWVWLRRHDHLYNISCTEGEFENNLKLIYAMGHKRKVILRRSQVSTERKCQGIGNISKESVLKYCVNWWRRKDEEMDWNGLKWINWSQIVYLGPYTVVLLKGTGGGCGSLPREVHRIVELKYGMFDVALLIEIRLHKQERVAPSRLDSGAMVYLVGKGGSSTQYNGRYK